jgi:UDP-N-acetylmuramyl pentapeptide phosphotransferase/UDP-N-acetylglucosamine-1-phosphate transferase
MLFLLKLTVVAALNHLMNIFFLKKNFLLDDINSSFHKKFTNSKRVPLSGGVVFIILFLIFIDQNYILKFFSIMVFFIGFFSDLKIVNSPAIRFICQIIFILLFVIFGNIYVSYTNIEFIDYFLSNKLFSLIFTIACLLILINGINFLDGLNSLVLVYNLLIIGSLSILAIYFNLSFDLDVLFNLIIILIVILIFNLFNKNFIGDSGAYGISFIVGAIIINFYNLNNNLMSALYVVILLWYPAIEILFSIIRKLLSGKNPLKPDNFHFHQLVYEFVNNKFKNRLFSNITSAILINFYNLLIFIISLFFFKETNILFLLIATNIIFYNMIYFILKKINKKNL